MWIKKINLGRKNGVFKIQIRRVPVERVFRLDDDVLKPINEINLHSKLIIVEEKKNFRNLFVKKKCQNK